MSVTVPQTTSVTTATLDFGEVTLDEIGQRLRGWMAASLPCVVCRRALQGVFGGDSGNQPSGGLAFMSQGHYGSTIYDPFSDELHFWKNAGRNSGTNINKRADTNSVQS